MAENRLIGEIMIEMGLASRDIIIECLNAQTDIYKKGEGKIPIGKLLVKYGYLSKSQLDAALEKQSKYRMPS